MSDHGRLSTGESPAGGFSSGESPAGEPSSGGSNPGTPLTDERATIESLADADGPYRVVGARRREEPVPARGLRFASRETARRAARAVERYRETLREYDPALPRYRIVVGATHTGASAEDDVEPSPSTPTAATRSS